MIRISMVLIISTSTLCAAGAEYDRPEGDGSVRAPATLASAAREDRALPPQSPPAPESPKTDSTVDAAAGGVLSPFSVAASLPRAAAAIALGGYDSAAGSFRARAATEARLLPVLALRLEYEHGPANGPSDRVSLGLRASFLNQAQHGLDLGAMAFYQPRDFRDEGNVVGGLSLARRFERLTLVLNPLVGSDPEGDDRSFELRFAGLYRTRFPLVFGLDSRGRYNFSSDQKRVGNWGVDWDAQAGATVALGIGPLLVTALMGPSLIQRAYQGPSGPSADRNLRVGLLAMAGAGGVF